MSEPILRKGMSAQEFSDGYFYAAQLKQFAREIGIPVGNRRKIELEVLIRRYLLTGHIETSHSTPSRKTVGVRDKLEKDAAVVNYVDDRRTKEFLLRCVHEQAPELKDKSGQWYWLNDWRRKKQEEGAHFTYKSLANHLRRLMETSGRLPQIPSARMNNFITDYRADSSVPQVSHKELMAQWMWLKRQPGPNTYEEYKRLQRAANNERLG